MSNFVSMQYTSTNWINLAQGYVVKALIFWSLANGVKGLISPGTTSGVMGTTSVVHTYTRI